jgi:arylsulfatase A-like enzyme
MQKKEMTTHAYSVTPVDNTHTYAYAAVHKDGARSAAQIKNETREPFNDDLFFRDSMIVSEAIKFLLQLADDSDSNADDRSPWFLGVGLKGTHMQYQMPAQFWEVYDNIFPDSVEEWINDTSKLKDWRLADAALTYPMTAPIVGHVRKTEATVIQYRPSLNRKSLQTVPKEPYQRIGNGRTISQRGHSELYRGYISSLTFADYELGKLLDVMDRLSLWKDTVVVFTSDHGMHVGEKVPKNDS